MLVLLVLLTFAIQPLFAQSTRIDAGTVSQDKFGFYWETRLQPGMPPMAGITTQTASEPGVIHRLLIDRTDKIYVGYDVLIQVLAEANTYNVTFRPLAMNSELATRFLGPDFSLWSQMRTPGWGLPNNQVIKGGDVLEVNLLTNRRTNQSVVEYVTVQEPAKKSLGFNGTAPERKFAFAPGPSRDFKAEDVEMTIQSPRLSINGKLDESTMRRYDEVSGPIVWFAAAKKGRFLLSLVPHPEWGFRKAGEVRGSSLSLVIGSDTFTLSTGGSIAPGQAAYSLYVLHEPDFRLTYPNADNSVFVMGALDRPESLKK
jgi:hypothetical protein